LLGKTPQKIISFSTMLSLGMTGTALIMALMMTFILMPMSYSETLKRGMMMTIFHHSNPYVLCGIRIENDLYAT